MAAILVDPAVTKGDTSPARRANCGGSLITPTVVLTAAHCVTNPRTGSVLSLLANQVVLGRTDLRSDVGGELIDVAKVVVHPSYDGPHKTFEYDAALLLLAHPSTAPTLPPADSSLKLKESQSVTILGWGSTREGSETDPAPSSPVLRSAQIPLWSSARCAAAYRHWDPGEPAPNPALMLCAAARAGGRSVCHGDSGGPLLVRDAAGVQRTVGIVSFAVGCARSGIPSVFTWVASPFLRGWIARRAAGLMAGDTDQLPPTISRLRIANGVVRYTASEPVRVVFALGRRRGQTVTLLDTALIQRVPAGESSFTFPRLLRGHPLRAGSYMISATATDASGNLSRSTNLRVELR